MTLMRTFRPSVDGAGSALRLQPLVFVVIALAGLTQIPPTFARPALGQSSGALEHFDHGKKLFAKGAYESAIRELKSALKDSSWSNEQRSQMCLLIAKSYAEDSKLKPAIEYAVKSLTHDNSALGHYYLAGLLLRSGQSQKAQEEIDAAISLDSKMAAAYSLKGDIQMMSNVGLALESYRRALDLTAPDQTGYLELKEAVETIRDYLSNKDRPGLTTPKALNIPMPSYTEEARKAHVTGLVRLMVEVLNTGSVGRVAVVTHLPHGLDQQAVKASRNLRFLPATLDGKPVDAWVRLEVEFNVR